MHACLKVDEILRSIASELVTPELWRAAVSLACCCKAFEDPVLDALWETKYDLMPLLRTFPQDIWCPAGHTVSATSDICFLSTQLFGFESL